MPRDVTENGRFPRDRDRVDLRNAVDRVLGCRRPSRAIMATEVEPACTARASTASASRCAVRCGHDRSARPRRPLAPASLVLARRRRVAARAAIRPRVVCRRCSPTAARATSRSTRDRRPRRCAADAIAPRATRPRSPRFRGAMPRIPRRLTTIVDPPPVLWTRGRADALSAPAVAIVGSRAASPYGARRRRTARRRSRRARRGRSSAAWRAASIRPRIAARSRPAASTVAVLGSGVDVDLSAGARGARGGDRRDRRRRQRARAGHARRSSGSFRCATGSSAACRARSSSSRRARRAGR